MKTLAMMKMEKNFVALEKGYPRQPYKKLTMCYLIERLEEEVDELKEAWERGWDQEAKLECADISNLVDYIFERLSRRTKNGA